MVSEAGFNGLSMGHRVWDGLGVLSVFLSLFLEISQCHGVRNLMGVGVSARVTML